MARVFMSGLDLSQIFYEDAVQPLLDTHYRNLRYSAALIGHGSEILGFDTPQSTDHDWGPRLMLFLSQSDHRKYEKEINQLFRKRLPKEIRGYPTNFIKHESGSAFIGHSDKEEIDHRVQILTVEGYFQSLLKFNPLNGIRAADWVKNPAHHLLIATSGRVFVDRLGTLIPIRKSIAYYPKDVWLYLLSAEWSRIGQEEHFMGRCGQVGDELGSRLVAGRLVSDLIRLCFLMERTYPPYIKWYGSAFGRLSCAQTMTPILAQVLDGQSWQERQKHLVAAYEQVATMHNGLGITEQIKAKVSPFHDRPFLVIHAERFASAIYAQIQDDAVLKLPRNLGSIDQFVDSTDALHYLDRFESLYESET